MLIAALANTVLGAACPQARTFLARTASINQITTNAYIKLINGLVVDGVWNTLDGLQVYATGNPGDTSSAASLLNLVSTSYSATLTNAPTFSPGNGYTTDGVTNYIDSGFDPSTAGGKFTQNDCSISCFNLTEGQTPYPLFGWYSALSGAHVGARNATDQMGTRVNQAAQDVVANTVAVGFFTGIRTASNALALYKNGVLLGTGTTASAALIAGNFRAGNSITGSYAARQYAAVCWGASRTPYQEKALYDRLARYLMTVRGSIA